MPSPSSGYVKVMKISSPWSSDQGTINMSFSKIYKNKMNQENKQLESQMSPPLNQRPKKEELENNLADTRSKEQY